MFKIVNNFDDLIKVFIIRGIVFLEEQNVPYEIEMDEFEYNSIHFLVEIDDEPIGAGRLRFIGEYAKLERIAIRKSWRGKGYGHQLVEIMLTEARKKGFSKFKMHAQAYLKNYYEQHGFKVHGDLFKEADIEHYLMIKRDK